MTQPPVIHKPGLTKTETYEERAKTLFVKEPANMKLLVVVDELLTGFDSPPCTYLYIDKGCDSHCDHAATRTVFRSDASVS
jgi:type I site-specific restriction-modification system R (restriction) subunit